MNFGAKDQNSTDYKLCFDIQLALVSFSYQNHSSLPNLSLHAAMEMLCYQQNWEFFGANIRREKESVLRFWVTTLKEYDLNCVSVISVCCGRPWIWRSNSICLPVFWPSMGSKSRKNLDSLNGSQRDHFPVGELARKRATLRAEYLSKSKELCHLQKQGQRLQKKVFRLNLI